MIVITDNSIFDLRMRPDPKEVAESIGFPPTMNFSVSVPFYAQSATTLESGIKFSYSQRTKEMFGRGMEDENKGNGVKSMVRSQKTSGPKPIGKRGHGKGAID